MCYGFFSVRSYFSSTSLASCLSHLAVRMCFLCCCCSFFRKKKKERKNFFVIQFFEVHKTKETHKYSELQKWKYMCVKKKRKEDDKNAEQMNTHIPKSSERMAWNRLLYNSKSSELWRRKEKHTTKNRVRIQIRRRRRRRIVCTPQMQEISVFDHWSNYR